MNKAYKNKQENKKEIETSHKGIEDVESAKKLEINPEVQNEFNNVYKRIGELEDLIKHINEKKENKSNNIHQKIKELEDLKNLNINKSENSLKIYEFIKDLKNDDKQIISIYLENKLSRSYGLNYFLPTIMNFFTGIGGFILGTYKYIDANNDIKVKSIIFTIIVFLICIKLIFNNIKIHELKFYNFLLTCIKNNN